MVDETDSRYLKAYYSISYFEFLEVIGRVSWFVYKNLDNDRMRLDEKIENVLKYILALVN